MQYSRYKKTGFTLLEVLVALVIIAIGMAAVIKATATTTFNSAYLRDKTFASWVAQNQLAEIELSDIKPKFGIRDGDETLAGIKWYWSIKVDKTEIPGINRVEITVRLDKDRSAQNYATLISLIHDPT